MFMASPDRTPISSTVGRRKLKGGMCRDSLEKLQPYHHYVTETAIKGLMLNGMYTYVWYSIGVAARSDPSSLEEYEGSLERYALFQSIFLSPSDETDV